MISGESKTKNNSHLSSVQLVSLFAVDNSNMNAGSVTNLHTFAKQRTNRNGLMYFDCVTAC